LHQGEPVIENSLFGKLVQVSSQAGCPTNRIKALDGTESMTTTREIQGNPQLK